MKSDLSEIILNIGGHGLGDCLLSFQISKLLSERKVKHKNLISSRNEVVNGLKFLYKNIIDFEAIDENIANDNAIEKNNEILEEIKNKYKSNNITYNVPDLLFTNPLSLNLDEYFLSPQIIKKTRTLNQAFFKKEKLIYFGLCSNTDGYLYHDIPSLLKQTAEKLPDYQIYFPYLDFWVRDIKYTGNFNTSFPKNVFIHKNPDFIESLEFLTKSCYGVFTCNGPSHIGYHLGIPRLILDPQFNKLLFISRWKEDYEECIPININPELASEIIKTNIEIPQTTMIDRKIVAELISKNYNNWKNILYFKF